MKPNEVIANKFIKGYKILNTVEEPVIRRVERIEIATPSEAPLQLKAPIELVPSMATTSSMSMAPIVSQHMPTSRSFPVSPTILPADTGRIKTGKKLSYPLIPREPKKDEKVFAYSKIYWDEKANHYIYELVEPELNDKLKKILVKVKELLEHRLDVDFSKLKNFEATDYLKKEIDEIIKYFGFITTDDEKKVLKYYIERDFIGLGKIEPLMRDPNIEDISCDGVGIPIFVFHRDSDIGSVITNISYDNADELDSFTIRLSQLCGKSISVAEPLLDGMLPDGSRVQLTLATDIARRGSNFSIRKFTEDPLTPVHFLNFGTVDVKTLAYLWFVVDRGIGLLVAGGTASGKTSFLNVLSLFIRPEKKIISIEDTGELHLPHSHWIPSVARTAIAGEGKNFEVDLFELLKVSLRQRPDYTIVGEVRGKEAYILFQQMATGHPSLATIHAENLPKLLDRLTTPPISLPPSLIGSVDLVVFLSRMHYKDKFLRKVTEVIEIGGFDQKTNSPVFNEIYRWDPETDKFEIGEKSILLKKISELSGVSEKDIRKEIENRILVLSWLQKHNITNYMDVYKVFSLFYNDTERLLSIIEREL